MSKWILLMGFILLAAACVTTKAGAPTGKEVTCPDGPRPLMDCTMAFEQYKRVIKFDLNVIQNFGTGIGIGAQPLINLDSITGDLMAHQHQVCIEYNSCLISKSEYVNEQRYLRRAQLKIREMANTARIGVDPALAPPPMMPPPPMGVPMPMGATPGGMPSTSPPQPMAQADPGVDQKMTEALSIPAQDVKPGGEAGGSGQAIFDELNNLGSKMQALIQKRGVGVTQTPTAPEEPKAAKKVSIDYSLKVRRPKTLPVTKNTQYDPVKFAQGVTLKTGDQFRVSFKTDGDGYVYVVNFDGAGKAQIIFPHKEAGADNFVKGGLVYEIPSSPANWYYLDEITGKETLYVIASPYKIANLDALVNDLRQGKDSGPQATLKTARLRGSLEALTRGVGVLPGEAAEDKSVSSSLISNERIEFNHQ
jgi:hypothetical protein